MNLKKSLLRIVLAAVMVGFVFADPLFARELEAPFPQYGAGPVEVRIYSDYFCPPCRAMKPQVELILQDLLKRNAITLIWVDTPFSRNSAVFAKYFLFALKSKNHADHASRVRTILNDATSDRQISTEAHIEALLKSKNIPYTAFDAKPVFERYNALIKEDRINATPTCVIIRAGKKDKFIGAPDIIAALKSLH